MKEIACNLFHVTSTLPNFILCKEDFYFRALLQQKEIIIIIKNILGKKKNKKTNDWLLNKNRLSSVKIHILFQPTKKRTFFLFPFFFFYFMFCYKRECNKIRTDRSNLLLQNLACVVIKYLLRKSKCYKCNILFNLITK